MQGGFPAPFKTPWIPPRRSSGLRRALAYRPAPTLGLVAGRERHMHCCNSQMRRAAGAMKQSRRTVRRGALLAGGGFLAVGVLCLGTLLMTGSATAADYDGSILSKDAATSRMLSEVQRKAALTGFAGAAAVPARAASTQPLQQVEGEGTGYSYADLAAESAGGGDGHVSPTFLAVLTRYADDISWLADNKTGVVDNSTGVPEWIMPLEIYQAADIGPNGSLPWPVFPGLPANASRADCDPLPAWPAWAKPWVAAKNRTRLVVPPGSLLEAERAAKLRVGMKWSSAQAKKEAKTRMGLQEDAPDIPEMTEAEETVDPGNATSLADATAVAPELLRALPEEEAGNRSATVRNPAVSPLQLRIVPNRAVEAMGYLSAIIDHYDALPDIMLFMHGHRTSWHTVLGQDWTMRRLVTHPPRELNSVGGYMPLGCQERWQIEKSQIFPNDIDANWVSPNGPRWHESLAARYAQAWREHLGEAYGMPLPDYIRVPCAASFAATREAIRKRPLAFYQDMRTWLLETHIESKWLGIVMEFNWGVMMANRTVVDPDQETCLCKLYNVCSLPAEM